MFTAALELWERDAVLRSWFGASVPTDVSGYESKVTRKYRKSIEEVYMISTVSILPDHDMSGFQVAGVFAWPITKEAPFVYGFGSAFGIQGAIDHAFRECVQRMAFLWGEPIYEMIDAEFTPTADYHQDYFLRQKNQVKIIDWLDGRYYRENLSKEATRTYDLNDVAYVQLTTPSVLGGVSVVRALDQTSLPLIFGVDYEHLLAPQWRVTAVNRCIHPIA